jgi:hypothetical protein
LDIYDLGHLIESMVYGNAAFTHVVEWPVPPPLAAVVPSLDEIYAIVKKIKVVTWKYNEFERLELNICGITICKNNRSARMWQLYF